MPTTIHRSWAATAKKKEHSIVEWLQMASRATKIQQKHFELVLSTKIGGKRTEISSSSRVRCVDHRHLHSFHKISDHINDPLELFHPLETNWDASMRDKICGPQSSTVFQGIPITICIVHSTKPCCPVQFQRPWGWISPEGYSRPMTFYPKEVPWSITTRSSGPPCQEKGWCAARLVASAWQGVAIQKMMLILLPLTAEMPTFKRKTIQNQSLVSLLF